jgi:hypothetical protein
MWDLPGVDLFRNFWKENAVETLLATSFYPRGGRSIRDSLTTKDTKFTMEELKNYRRTTRVPS